MAIKLDRSQASGILITCTECPYWYSFRFDPREAYRSGEDHDVRVHDVAPNLAATNRRIYESRHAVDS